MNCEGKARPYKYAIQMQYSLLISTTIITDKCVGCSVGKVDKEEHIEAIVGTFHLEPISKALHPRFMQYLEDLRHQSPGSAWSAAVYCHG